MSISSLVSKFRSAATVSLVSVGLLFTGTSGALAAVLIIPDSLPDARVGVLYSQDVTLSATVSPAPVWSLTGGALPSGIDLTPFTNGQGTLIKGTPSTVGASTFTLKVDNGVSYDQIKTYTINVLPMEVTARSLPNARVGSTYSQALTVEGGTAPHTWRVTGGQLPVGLNLSSSGVISGTPLYALAHTFTAKVTDAMGRSAERAFNLTVDPSNLEIATSSLPPGTVGTSYAFDLAATGGALPYTWSLNGRSWLPPGLTLSAAGNMRGNPSVAGNYTFTLMLRDAVGTVKTKGFTLSVVEAGTPVLAISTPSLSNGTVGVWYSQSLNASGGVAPYSWNFASGVLPPGLTFSTNGSIYGTPTVAGTYSSNIEVFDARGAFVGRSYTITISPSSGDSGDLTARLNNFARIGVGVHSLVKLPDDGNRFTQEDSAVYYLGADGKRHAFPHEKVFFTWYSGFSGVRVSAWRISLRFPWGQT